LRKATLLPVIPIPTLEEYESTLITVKKHEKPSRNYASLSATKSASNQITMNTIRGPSMATYGVLPSQSPLKMLIKNDNLDQRSKSVAKQYAD
jgi:hypothetical protein